jgi:riboflavin kinase/FMN adenylyltransferase
MNTAISIGNFDAVHLGHVALVEHAREAVGERGRVEVWSFDPPPVSILDSTVQIDHITTFSQRKALLINAGADDVIKITPTKKLLGLHPKAYIKQVMDEFSPNFIVEGAGFRFGKNRNGDIHLLQSLGETYNFACLEVQSVEIILQDSTVAKASSSLTRQLLQEGRVADVSCILGRQYELSGIVTQGDERGRKLGIPTANLGNVQTMLPKNGIYSGVSMIDGVTYAAAISVGTKPTFGSHDRVCEVHLIDFEGKIGQYNWPLSVTFSHWIRDQIKFDTVEALTIAIEQDIEQSKNHFDR